MFTGSRARKETHIVRTPPSFRHTVSINRVVLRISNILTFLPRMIGWRHLMARWHFLYKRDYTRWSQGETFQAHHSVSGVMVVMAMMIGNGADVHQVWIQTFLLQWWTTSLQVKLSSLCNSFSWLLHCRKYNQHHHQHHHHHQVDWTSWNCFCPQTQRVYASHTHSCHPHAHHSHHLMLITFINRCCHTSTNAWMLHWATHCVTNS